MACGILRVISQSLKAKLYVRRSQVQKRVAEKDFPNKDKFYMAKINCQDSEELCNEQHVDGYPSVFLFKNGKRIEEYSGDQKALSIWQYILDQVTDFQPEGAKANHDL